jgi:hypothetical protein
VATFLDSTNGRKLNDPCRYLGADLTVGNMAGIQCFEYLLHGLDMARAVGRDWPLPESIADPALAVVGPVLLAFPDPAKVGDLQASFAIESGCSRICCQVHDGRIEPVGTDADTDCSITGRSSQILLWLTGRVGWEAAGLSASGRLPEVAPTLADKLMN